MRFIELYMNVSTHRNKKQIPYLEMRLSCTFCLNPLLIQIYVDIRGPGGKASCPLIAGLVV